MFDTAKGFKITAGGAQIRVRQPTDEEWADHMRALTVIRWPGRSVSKSEPGKLEHQSELLEKIRADVDGQQLTAEQVTAVFAVLDGAVVKDCSLVGDLFTVVMDSPFGKLSHRLAVPSQKQVRRFAQQSRHVTPGRGFETVRYSAEPAGELYDKLVRGVAGYAAHVPLSHKMIVVSEIVERCEGGR